ncbi:MAG: rhamnulokinase family protein [Pirellulales bacterium]
MKQAYLAIDLGAESGRVIAGTLASGRMQLEELYRFVHEPVWMPTGLHWDITGMWREIVAGLRKAAAWARAFDIRLVSVGVDTWGVDWALVDKAGELVGLPHAYRDPRNQAAYEEVIARLGADRIYQTTGIQFMALNTLYSLYAQKHADPDGLAAAAQLLFMPDLFHYWLSGEKSVEATIASTSQMVDCHTGRWATEMLGEMGLPTGILSEPVAPGTVVGTIRVSLAADTGLPSDLKVIAPPSHDTASAIAAVPAVVGSRWCYLSSGTWSLLGAELDAPCTSPAAQAAMFTNELGVLGTTRFLKNIPGLWLVQECRRDLARKGREMDYAGLTKLAAEAEAFRTLIDPAHADFQTPGEMLEKIATFCERNGHVPPDSPGRFVRCCLESLALKYRDKLATLESILDRKFDVIHVVGGGGKNELLCQMTADATGRRVVVGPYEATALGNALVQAMSAGDVRDLAELRCIVAQSFDLVTYEPNERDAWNAAAEKFAAVCG